MIHAKVNWFKFYFRDNRVWKFVVYIRIWLIFHLAHQSGQNLLFKNGTPDENILLHICYLFFFRNIFSKNNLLSWLFIFHAFLLSRRLDERVSIRQILNIFRFDTKCKYRQKFVKHIRVNVRAKIRWHWYYENVIIQYYLLPYIELLRFLA